MPATTTSTQQQQQQQPNYTISSNIPLTQSEESALHTFNTYYDNWCEEFQTQREHLKKTLYILTYIKEDLANHKLLYRLCDKGAQIHQAGDDYYLGKLMHNVLNNPTEYFHAEEFEPDDADDCCLIVKNLKEEVDALAQEITRSNDYKYYYLVEEEQNATNTNPSQVVVGCISYSEASSM